MSNQQGPMFDSRFFVTIILVLGIWVGWQSYMSKKYPNANKKTNHVENVNTAETVPSSTEESATKSSNSKVSKAAETKTNKTATQQPETLEAFDSENLSFEISSHGMALKNVVLKKYTDREKNNIVFADGPGDILFGTSLLGRRDVIDFKMKRSSPDEIVGEAVIDGMKITKILQINSKTFSIDTKIRVQNIAPTFTGISAILSEPILKSAGGSFLRPSTEHQEFYVYNDGSQNRKTVNVKSDEVENYSRVKIASFGSQYFATAIVDKSSVMPEFKVVTQLSGEEKKLSETNNQIVLGRAFGSLSYSQLSKADEFNVEYTTFTGPKSIDLLKSVDTDLSRIVNLGFFTSIAKIILWLMRIIHSAIGNWGVSIIFLTIIVRILVLPFNLIGYKQMRAMAKIQPHMKELRERYKNDQQRLNQEMMVLMKEAKANPLGGCLPMFFQIPVFFALYQVIGQSIELYQAPFVFWIHDLSSKDPYYTLPAIMGVTMFLQQKITPSTMDPAQQKMMTYLPLVFTFFMISLPSGLTLYISVSSIFGVLQQLYFMKNNNDPKTVDITANRRTHVGISR